MNIVIFGPPGAGKGTQSKYLQEKFGFTQVSSGDLVRAEIASGTETGKLIKESVEKGSYPPDDVIISLVKKVYNPEAKGYLFDGFPRTVNQAGVLEEMLAEFDQKVDCVLDIVVSDESIQKRLLGRYSCNTCGAIYNRYFKNPHKEGVCDVCHGKNFNTRTDDTVATILNRLNTYHTLTKPVLAFYKQKTEVIEIDGEQDLEAVQKQVELSVAKVLNKKQTGMCAHT